AQNERLKKDIARLGEAAKRAAAWSDKTERTKYGKNDSGLKSDRGYVGHKSAKMMKRAKSAEARAQKGMEQKAGLLKNAETVQKLKLGPLEYRAERVLGLYGVEIAYGNVKACGPVDL
ncbi:MAG: Lsa family ABC-F type ribosomal protection protein, partial [Clostridia bacterium]|nr:Lsa family ABC-F type ribosomal protection protein [Clostridia bacterium]